MPRSIQQTRLRMGFIGAGDIAALQMAKFASREDVELVAFTDVNEQILAKRQASYPAAAIYTDYRKMLKQQSLDAVSVCTPNRFHAEPTIAALKAGCHVLCEKPLAMTLAEGRRMARTAQQAHKQLVVAFQYRLDPRTQYLRRAYEEGAFGDVLFARVQAMRRRGIPNWGVFGQKALSGGGPIIDIGVHVLEMAHYTMGSPQPVSASADMFTYLGNQPSDRIASPMAGWDYKTYDVEDLAVGRIRFANGAVLHIECAFAAHISERNLMNFQLMGSKGGATWDPTVIHTDEAGHMVNKSPAWLADTSFNAVFNRKIDSFVEQILYKGPCAAPIADALMVQSMLNALYDSAQNAGKDVRIRL
ncbi:MAG: Gfo/Idh/MocA family protein [bacterium]